MSVNTAVSLLVFGGAAAGDQAARASTNPSTQLVGETLSVATHGRRVRGPRSNGLFSYHAAMTAVGGAGSAFTVWYSNLPDPDPAVDGHWVDSGIAPVALTALTPFLGAVTDKLVEWVRYKAVIGTTPGSFWLYHLAEGREA